MYHSLITTRLTFAGRVVHQLVTMVAIAIERRRGIDATLVATPVVFVTLVNATSTYRLVLAVGTMLALIANLR